MLRNLWIHFTLVAILGFAHSLGLAAPGDSASTTEMVRRATSIETKLSGSRGDPCRASPPYCPHFLNEVIADDKADGYLIDFNWFGRKEWPTKIGKMLEGRFAVCLQNVDARGNPAVNRFPTPPDMQKYAEAREFETMGAYNHLAIQGCLAQSPLENFNKTAKYYYSMARFDRGIQDAQQEVARINALLGDQNSVGSCDLPFADANTRCEELNACPVRAETFNQVLQQTSRDEVAYKNSEASLKKMATCLSDRKLFQTLQREIQKSGSAEHCEVSLGIDGGASDSCRTLTGKDLTEFKKCDQQAQENLKSMALLEKANPWFGDENYWDGRKKGKPAQDLISNSLKKTRKALRELVKELNHSSQCLNGSTTQNCTVGKFRESLLATRELPETYSFDLKHNALQSYMNAQQCIEEGANDRDRTASILRTTGRDALLTIGTMGVGGVALKAAQMAGRGLRAAETAKTAATFSAIGVDLFYFTDAAGKAINQCLTEYDKQVVDLNKSALGHEHCPNPLNDKVASERAGESCKAAMVDAGLNSLPFAPVLAKKARSFLDQDRPSGWVDHAKRSPETTVRKTPQSPRTRISFIDDNLSRDFTTVPQNEKWMALAANAKPDGKTRFFEVENSVMKELNDVTQDKNFVTALTNKHKSLIQNEIEAFSTKFPAVEVIPYSDFKAMRFALRPKPPATALPAGIEDELQALFKRANKEFSTYMKEHQLLRDDDQPESWFRAGLGETADQATLASRYSRNAAGENRIRAHSDKDLQENLGITLSTVETYRAQIQSELGKSGLMTYVPNSGKTTLRQEVFDTIRKTDTTAELMDSVKKTTGTVLTEAQAVRLRDYAKLVDEFSPGIHIAKRQIASLSDSLAGGFSLDFAGMGSRNAQATADALAASRTLGDAVERARNSEKGVTRAFRERKADVQATIGDILKKNGIEAKIIDSGDDMVVKPSKPIPEKVRAQIATELAGKIDPSSVRMAHVSPNVAVESDRALMGTHGETIEKLVRKNLQGQMDSKKLSQILLVVDMKGAGAGQGAAELMMGLGAAHINETEKQQIKKAFQKAVESLNESLRAEKLTGNYRTAGGP